MFTLTVKRCKDLIIMQPLSQTCKTLIIEMETLVLFIDNYY